MQRPLSILDIIGSFVLSFIHLFPPLIHGFHCLCNLGSDMVTWVWASYMSGQLVAAFTVGFMADAGYIRQIFWVGVPLAGKCKILLW